jgi:hypothetical protein
MGEHLLPEAVAPCRVRVLDARPVVDNEVRWWLEHRSPATMLIGLTGGKLAWDAAGRTFDPVRSSALPPPPSPGRVLRS